MAHLAADLGGSGDPLSLLLQYGILGIFAVMLILYTRSSIKRELEKADRAEQQVRELNDYIRNELLPKQVEATVLYKQVAEVLADAVQIISEIKILDRNERRRGL